jgi:short-subunit dehydrogenase
MPASSEDFAVVTGASSGIGAAIARRLAGDGRALALLGRDRTRLEATAEACRRAGAPLVRIALADQCDRAAFAEALAGFEAERPIGLFVASAGILDGRRDGETIERAETAATVIDTDFCATVDAVHRVLPAMLGRGGGAIVLVASLAAFAPLPDAPAYSGAKAGLLAWGLGMREALRGSGVRVCVACPSYVTSAMTARHIGPHPGEIDADDAARRILDGSRRDRAVIAFPFATGWLARLALLAPEAIRRRAMGHLRFHIEP